MMQPIPSEQTVESKLGMATKVDIVSAPAHRPSPELEPGIWSRLPFHLLEIVLSHFPLSSLLALRSTCKYFNSLISSSSFLSLLRHYTDSHCSPLSYFLFSHPQLPQDSFFLFDPRRSRWRRLAVTTIAGRHLISSSVFLLSSFNGLLCFATTNCFLVVNLLTKSTRNIGFPEYPFASATLIPSVASASTLPRAYKLCVLTKYSYASPSSVYVYDSTDGVWSRYSSIGPVLHNSVHQQGVFVNGSLYFTTKEPFSVVSFDVQAGRWEESPVELPGELTFMRLVGGDEEEESAGDNLVDQKRKKGKLFLVGGIGSDGICKRLKVWEMRYGGEDGGSEWTAVGILPELMCRKFVSACYHNYEHVYCLWQDGLIGICCYTWPEMLVYNVKKQSWRWLEKCSLLPVKWSCGFRWFSFAPNLCAAA